MTADLVRTVFALELADLELRKAKTRGRKAEGAIRSLVGAYVKTQLARVLPWAKRRLASAVKAADDTTPPIEGWPAKTIDDLVAAFVAAGSEGAGRAAIDMDLELGQIPEAVLDYAKERAGQLIGKKLVGGEWVNNPNARWRIDETLREDTRRIIQTAIEEGDSAAELTEALESAFGGWRAETIARTEFSYAFNNGTAAVMSDAGVESVTIMDGDGCLPDGHLDGAPAASGEVDSFEPENQADGQIWPLATFQAHMLGHPRCQRAAAAYYPPEAES